MNASDPHRFHPPLNGVDRYALHSTPAVLLVEYRSRLQFKSPAIEVRVVGERVGNGDEVVEDEPCCQSQGIIEFTCAQNPSLADRASRSAVSSCSRESGQPAKYWLQTTAIPSCTDCRLIG